MEIKGSKELKWLPRLRSPPDTRDKSKYCDFHRDHGHTTEDCFALKREIEALIKGRFLGFYISNDKCPMNNQNRDKGLEGLGNKQQTTEDITFGTGDLEGIAFSQDDALVISAIITNFEFKRILADNGNVANVLFHEVFVQMGISSKHLKPVKTPLQGFGGGVITPKDIVGLPLTLGDRRIQAIVSTFHLAMKFPTSNGIGVVRGSQTVA
ncbi:uncharacterized protein LOC111376963 [Olea europaea var. sylvestris]|uniref:uncharacterized protein LOC111376963 n=1 Tax=Olea europaea var. sylvestris TaxID=158386 RepID=UPI000C1CCEB5|nr:uncharacterized protein LOC111376963 [Olea europaea var. sylvestris]